MNVLKLLAGGAERTIIFCWSPYVLISEMLDFFSRWFTTISVFFKYGTGFLTVQCTTFCTNIILSQGTVSIKHWSQKQRPKQKIKSETDLYRSETAHVDCLLKTAPQFESFVWSTKCVLSVVFVYYRKFIVVCVQECCSTIQPVNQWIWL